MAIIYSYPIATPQDTDLLIISRTPTDPDEISNYSVNMSSVADYVIDKAFNGTDRYIPRFDGTSSLVNSVIYEDTDGHVGVGVVGTPPNPVHKFEVFDLRDENPSSDYSSVVTTHVNAPFTGGAGGILSRLSTDSGATYAGQISLVPGTKANDVLSNIRLSFHANSDMDTSSPSNLAGTVTHDDTNAHWILNGTLEETTTATLKVNGTSEFTDQVTIPETPVAGTDAASKAYVDSQNTGRVTGTGTTNVLPIWTDGPNSDLGDSLITQTKIDGGTIFDLNAITTGPYTPAVNTKLLDLNSGSTKKFSITQDGGGGVVLPSGGGVTNPGPSFNMGGGAFSNGKSGVAMGSTTTAFGNGSLAANFLTLASGGGASAFGLLTEASALASAAFGNKSVASGNYSIASGQDSIASGQSSVAIGEKGDAQGKNTFVQGFGGTATANNAVKFGYEGSASGNNSAKFGFESVASSANSLATGTGTTASGLQSIATGDNNVVSGGNSFIGGKNSTVTGQSAFAFGQANTVSSNTSAAFGQSNTVNGFQSFVAGSNNDTDSRGDQILLGVGLIGSSNQSVVLGRHNKSTDNFDKFQIGNGQSSGLRSNALSINGAGNIKIPTYGSGSVTGTAAYNLSVDADGKIIETTNSTAPDYLSFVCLLSQSGTANPQPDLILENSLGVPTPFIAFTRVSSGEYNLSATGKFKLLKTIVFLNGGSAENNHDVAWEVIDANNLRIRTHNSDGKLTKASLEIRTYN